MDGTRWSLTIAHQGCRVKSDGYNAFPEEHAAFYDAVQKLGKDAPGEAPQKP